ncbi:hypothetical protein PVL29_014763 [Vitis rotundifolia]|uniref:Uncharacterized protein n=1 Tax=Vitis rotundifolia TaxID=103349 RepID=A0AA38ZHY7_VITRO|nr:hypothetical protein PVL29_014763 [Vitis rotundifolia]
MGTPAPTQDLSLLTSDEDETPAEAPVEHDQSQEANKKKISMKQHWEIHHLVDKTVQGLARKVYMQGVVKQATDSRNWDLWSW